MIQVKYIKWILLTMVLTVGRAQAQDVSSLKDTLKVDGDVNLRNVVYGVSGLDDRRVPYSFVLGANVTVSKGEFSLPFGITYSEQERSFSQPFNQFGIAPSYKWAKAYLGFNSLDWSTYTLGGAQFLGAGLELNPKKIRFGFMYGRFRRGTPIDSIGFIDHSTPPSYQRNGWATKIGVGDDSKHVDLIIFKGKDKTDGVSPLMKDSLTFIFPAENTAIGLKGLLPIGKIATFLFDGGISLFSRDITSPNVDTSGAENSLLFLNSLHNVKLSTSVYYGANAGLKFNLKGHAIGFNTRYVLPDYQAMGIFYMDNDVFSYGFTHAFSFWKSKVNLNYGLNRLNDNLLDKKPVTTIRLQPLVSLSVNPSNNWGVSANWNNFYTRQEDGLIELSDSFRMDQSNPGLTITPYAQWGDTVTYHSVFLTYADMQLLDNNAVTAVYSQYRATVYGLNYSQSMIPRNMSLSGGLNFTRNQNAELDETAYGLSLGASRSSDANKWTAGANLSFQFSNVSNTISLNLNGNYNLKHQQALDFGLTVLNNQAKQATSIDFTEVTFMVTYRKNFSYVHKRKK